MIDFSTLQGLTIPEGVVAEIADASGRALWTSAKPIVLEVEKITADTYAGETAYTGEEFILLDIYPRSERSTVKVTYGGLTKTLTFSGTNAQQVFFGTFNGVSDSVATPASGTLTIEGGYNNFAVGSYRQYNSLQSKSVSFPCGCITSVKDWGSVTSIQDFAFDRCANLALTELPSGLTSIGMGAFSSCTNLALTSLPSGLTSIEGGAFQNCTNLALTSLPSGITSIGDSAFSYCTNLVLTALPSGITSIGFDAFYDCTAIKSITLPASITSIGDGAFMSSQTSSGFDYTNYWGILDEITLLSTIPPTINSEGGKSPFDYTYYSASATAKNKPVALKKIIVPKGCGEIYKSAIGWSDYATIIVEAL